jgi:hypothetical protein
MAAEDIAGSLPSEGHFQARLSLPHPTEHCSTGATGLLSARRFTGSGPFEPWDRRFKACPLFLQLLCTHLPKSFLLRMQACDGPHSAAVYPMRPRFWVRFRSLMFFKFVTISGRVPLDRFDVPGALLAASFANP